MTAIALNLRYASTCRTCGATLERGARAFWDRETKTATCHPCAIRASAAAGIADEQPPTVGTAGRSARREYERRAERERRKNEALVAQDAAWRKQTKAERPIIGRIASALTPRVDVVHESQATRAWATGADGEERVADWLTRVPGIAALHDRRIPHSRANIDHIVVTSRGVHVIDAKRYTGRVERRDVGSFFRPDERLFVGRRDCTKLTVSVLNQAKLVNRVVDRCVPVFAGLCFVGGEWPLLGKPFYVGTTWVGWPKAMAKWVAEPGDLDEATIERTARAVADALPPA